MARNRSLIRFAAASRSRNISLVVILLLAIAIPFTVLSLQQRQQINQNASVCIPRPACLSAKPPCLIAEPAQGWCPLETSVTPPAGAYVTPKVTCIPRPACLDSVPRCLLAEPATGWCPTGMSPTPIACPQVVSPAKNPYSGQCINFPNPCRVPKGWVKTVSCSGY